MPPKPKSMSERLANKWKVNESSGCWEWTASRTPFGYGKFSVGGKHGGWMNAMRAAWLVWVGPIPDGMCVCHKCDNPSCINPEHLFAGSAADNMHDMYGKSRNAKKNHNGRRNPRFGATLSAKTKAMIANSLSKTYRITKPTGETVVFSNLKKFSKENNLSEGMLSALRRGLYAEYKGFSKLEYVI